MARKASVKAFPVNCGRWFAVAVADINKEQADKVAAEIGGKGYYVNVASHEDVKKLVADVVADYGRLDVMVNNAGICRIEPFLGMTDKGLGRHRGHQHQRRLLRDV